MPESRFRKIPAFILDNQELLEPQRTGWRKLFDYFRNDPDSDTTPALCTIPTGCGKTGLMALAPFEISEGRVLSVGTRKRFMRRKFITTRLAER